MQAHAPPTALAHVLAIDGDPLIREANADESAADTGYRGGNTEKRP